ncbi:MAG: pyruvate synthase subunit beta [Phycisphaerae bacterium]|jgi:pyruvate ferredoxin oxidoreductase beta subunit/2-oxoisovalerate ferredoxin oxidoreductase beta subunit|nr:pyruvate synthase subunit beta [Phycisphaerae bacterium]MCZ2398484.1 pyruvate synthase subunit beta [Phycisphaerae bacterium]NUQ49616.1 pyruvate synthase subunit beta [Phycisphaerae bacterium]
MTAVAPQPNRVSQECIMRPGNTNCAGCGMSIGLQLLAQALEGERPYLAIPACCGIVTAGAFPTSAYASPTIATTFASSAAVATGISAVLRQNGDESPVICWTGDGGTYDIGVAALSAAAERNEDVIYICYDNEIYGNTGGQRSSATPAGVATTTTPHGKTERKKDMMAIMAAHRIPYAATLSVAHRGDFLRKIRHARATRGFRFLLMLSPCPTGWKSEPAESVELIRAAVGCGLFPLYEVFDGLRYRINDRPDGTPVEEYVSRQRRYTSAQIDPAVVRARVAEQWRCLEALATAFPAD